MSHGFGYLPCPVCGEEGVIKVDLVNLDTFTCEECNDEFEVDRIEAIVSKWKSVLDWFEKAPKRET